MQKKKAFTLVELLVVIAILAILAAVSVVGYISFTEKAKTSADEQAVTQFNNLLDSESISTEIANIEDVRNLFIEQNMNVDSYTALTKDRNFNWCKDINKIIILDEQKEKIVYPDNFKDYNYNLGSLFSLNGKVETSFNYTVEKDSNNKINKVTITDGSEYLGLVANLNEKSNEFSDSLIIKIENDIDLMGSNDAMIKSKDFENIKNITFEGTANNSKNPTIYSFLNTEYEFQSGSYYYSSGILSTIDNQDIIFKNLNFNNLQSDLTSAPNGNSMCVGGLIGSVYGNSNVTFDNVHISNATIFCMQFVGGYIGRILYDEVNSLTGEGVTINFLNSSIKDSKVNSAFGHNAGLVGAINEMCNFTDEENKDPNKALDRIKKNLVVNNTVVENVNLDIKHTDTINFKITKDTEISHTNYVDEGNKEESISKYKLSEDIALTGGITYDSRKRYYFYSSALLFNINPTFRHDTGPSRNETFKYDDVDLYLSNALIGINSIDILEKLIITVLEKPIN